MTLEQAGERTTASSVRFHHPFRLGRDGRELPPGTYVIHIHEDAYQGGGAPMFMAKSIDFVVETNGTTTTRIVKPSDLRAARIGMPLFRAPVAMNSDAGAGGL
jgi:hypothetical protein